MIDAYVTNLGKYMEGELCAECLKLPTTKEDVKALLSRIGVDGVLYEETFVTHYETEVEGLHRLLGENESIDELNYLAAMLDDLDDREIAKFEAALEYGSHTSDIQQLINLAQNLDCYDLDPDIMDNDDLGLHHVEQMVTISIPEHLEHYIDYESYGRDIAINEGGVFTGNGYITNNGDTFTEHYKGRHIPDEYRVFAYPDPPVITPVKKQLEMYGIMARESAAPAKHAPSLAHESR